MKVYRCKDGKKNLTNVIGKEGSIMGKIHLSQLAKMTFSFHQQMALSIDVLLLPVQDLAHFVEEEIEKNPLMEMRKKNNYEEVDFNQIKEERSTFTELLGQARELVDSAENFSIAKAILGNLNEYGFFDLDVKSLVEDLSTSTAKIEAILKLLQKNIEPAGICARDYKEHLLLKLSRAKKENSTLYYLIVHHYEKILQGSFSSLRKKYALSIQEMQKIVHDLKQIMTTPKLTPSKNPMAVVADILVNKKGDKWSLEVRETLLPEIKWKYKKLPSLSKEEMKMIQQYKIRGKWLIRSIDRRKELLQKVGYFLLSRQAPFFEGGSLLPLTIKEVAAELALHESAVRRVFAHKYIEVENRLFPLSDFISNKIGSHSKTTIKEKIKGYVADDPTLSDRQLAQILQKEGITLSRRTVAKYRKQNAMPSRRNRKIIS